MNALFTMLLLTCMTTTFAAWLVVALRRPVAQLSRRFLSLPRTTQAALIFAVGVATAAAQKSGTEANVSHAEAKCTEEALLRREHLPKANPKGAQACARHGVSAALLDAASVTLANPAESVLAVLAQGMCLSSNDVVRGYALVVPQANAKVTFAGDGASNLSDPAFVAKAGETNRVTLLVGKEYKATCALPFEIVGTSSASIEVGRPDGRRAEICWPVMVALADGQGASFGMTVSPSSLVGTFFWTNSCCGVALKDDSFSFLCADGDCRCTGCPAMGFFRYEGFRIACVGGSCGCLPSGGPPQEAEPASVSVSFSKGAVIFEDEYDNSPTERVGWRSTETVLRCSASGGGNGGFLYVSLEGSDRLVRQGGPSLPYSKALAADETVAFECRYRATKASDAADDIKVTATLAENETGATRSAEAMVTAIRLTFTPEVEAPKNTSVGRHRYGVCEIVNCFQLPAAPKVAWQTTGCAAIGDARFRFPPTAAEDPICASCRGETYIPALSVVEPSGVEGRAEDVVLYGVATNHAGGVGMQLGIYVLPGEVSFSGLMVEEIPCDRGSHGGYFDNALFSGIWTHSSDNGAGRWWNVSVIDNRMGGEAMVDTVAIMSELPRIDPAGEHTDDLQCSWSDGYIEWEIPFGWNAVDGEQAPCREFATDTRHRLEIDAGGTVRIQKLANEVVREIGGKVVLNGERRDQ